MHAQYLLLILFLYSIHSTFPLSIPSKPIQIVYTPNSILEHKENYKPHTLDGRIRYSTCTGAAWFHENYLAVLNLYGRKIITYAFNPEEKTFDMIQEINNNNGAQLYNPENLTVSPDGTLLAVCSDSPYPGTKFYAIDLETHHIHPEPILSLPANGLVHNVRFTSGGTYFASAGWDENKSICIYKLMRHKNILTAQLVHSVSNTMTIKPKGIHFTKDNQFMVVCYAPRVTTTAPQHTTPRIALLVSYKFNPSNGIVGEIISSKTFPSSMEDLAFLNNDHEIIVTDQAGDRLIIFPFNPETGSISDTHTLLHGTEARLSFPHGIGVSHNGKYFVVSNYGNDTFNLYYLM